MTTNASTTIEPRSRPRRIAFSFCISPCCELIYPRAAKFIRYMVEDMHLSESHMKSWSLGNRENYLHHFNGISWLFLPLIIKPRQKQRILDDGSEAAAHSPSLAPLLSNLRQKSAFTHQYRKVLIDILRTNFPLVINLIIPYWRVTALSKIWSYRFYEHSYKISLRTNF